MTTTKCQIEAINAGGAYPRTCPTCGLGGQCAKGLPHPLKKSTPQPQAPAEGRYRFLLGFLIERGVLTNTRYNTGAWSLQGIALVDDSGLRGAGWTPEEAIDNAIVAVNLDPQAREKFWRETNAALSTPAGQAPASPEVWRDIETALQDALEGHHDAALDELDCSLLLDLIRTRGQAPAPAQEPVDAGDEPFEAWWGRHGQFCRAGGGAYEKTFAYRAWQAALEVAPQPAQEPAEDAADAARWRTFLAKADFELTNLPRRGIASFFAPADARVDKAWLIRHIDAARQEQQPSGGKE